MPRKIKPSMEWLLVLIPVAIVLRFWPGQERLQTALFICSGLAIIPLAGLMGRATERLADRMGQSLGGLLNATFGNAAELIIALMALNKGLTDVVKASITGSIIGNILLVFGASALAGGLKFKEQRFNSRAVQTSTTCLWLAAIGLLIPTVFHHTAAARFSWTPELEQALSTAIAVVLFGTYICLLLFSLRTHRALFAGSTVEESERTSSANNNAEVHGQWSFRKALVVLVIATAFVAWLSEFLVGAVESAHDQLGVSEVFIGVIIVAVIGNAAEHSTAVLVARKNKMDLSLGIAIGSSLQIALFVAPLLVFVSHALGRPMDLEFTLPEIVAVIVAVVTVAQISNDGETNWLEGVQLVSVYIILGVLFYFLPEPR